MQTIDDQPPVFYLAVRQRSEDLKHLIPRPGPPELHGDQLLFPNCSLKTLKLYQNYKL